MASKARTLVKKARRKVEVRFDPERRRRTQELKALGPSLSAGAGEDDLAKVPEELRAIAERFTADDAALVEGAVPLLWWTKAHNYGDFLSPFIVGRASGRTVQYADNGRHTLAIGSIVGRASKGSTVWGSGLASGEPKWGVSTSATYRAVRGPLTRALLRNIGATCPRVYGDPALLLPLYFWPDVESVHEIGVVVRWSEDTWRTIPTGPGVKLIDFGSSDVATVTRELLSCKRIVSSSLHGLIVADAYGIPNAWLDSDGERGGSRPAGGEFKFYDYMLSVEKVRHAQEFDLTTEPLTVERLLEAFEFDARPIVFDHEALLAAAPFLRPE